MAFPPGDLRRTIRRSQDGGVQIYPRLLRDGLAEAQIEYALRYFEGQLGRARRDLEREVLVELFGDHRLARCIVACLGSHYSFRPRPLGEVLGPSARAGLARAGLSTPAELRHRVFRFANDHHHGFIGEAEREAALAPLAGELGLSPGELDAAFALDHYDLYVLTRRGATPRPADVVARYHYHAVTTCLRHSATLSLDGRSLRPRPLRDLAERHGVEMELARGRCLLHGREDTSGSWGRHGRRLARLAVALLASGLFAAHEGVADVRLGEGQYRFHLTPEVLGHLGAHEGEPALAEPGAGDPEHLAAEVARQRRQGVAEGWRWRRLPEAIVYEEGVVLPEALVERPEGMAALFLPATAPAARALARVLPRLQADQPAVVVAPPSLMPLLAGAPVPLLPTDASPAAILATLARVGGLPDAAVG